MNEADRSSSELLPRVARGEAEAVRACLDRYSPLVYSMVRKVLRDASAVEDVVQEVFIELWQKAERFDPTRASEATFVATIARRRAIDRGRRIQSAPPAEDIEGTVIGGADEALDHIEVRDEARLARAALDRLPEAQRRVILMSVVQGLTHQEISTATGVPLGTVKSHIRRGLMRAAEELSVSKQEAES